MTPLDIHNKEFKRVFRGYSPEEVDEFLDEIVEQLDDVIQENQLIKDEVDELRSRVQQYRQMEDTLQHTLVIAQETADEVRENARKEAQVIIGEARAEIRRMRDDADEYIQTIQQSGKKAREQVIEYLSRAKANLRTEIDFVERAAHELSELDFKNFREATGREGTDDE